MKNRKRIVVKIGTSTVCHANGAPNLRRIEKLVRVLCDMKNDDYEIVLVTSGAIGLGANKMGLREKPALLADRQAAAAIGQGELMSVYDRLFLDYGSLSGQILLTKGITEDEKGKQNVIATFNALLEKNAIPVVNENDSVATEEIVYGDNDTLSAIVATFIQADLLVILSDIEGLYDSNPAENPNAQLIRVVEDITKVENLAGGSGSSQGTGGMVTKLHAAAIAKEEGIPTIITSGKEPSVLYDIVEGKEVGTYFPTESGEKTWLKQ